MPNGHCSMCWHTSCSILEQENIQHHIKTWKRPPTSRHRRMDRIKERPTGNPSTENYLRKKAHAVSCQPCSLIFWVRHYCWGAWLKTGVFCDFNVAKAAFGFVLFRPHISRVRRQAVQRETVRLRPSIRPTNYGNAKAQCLQSWTFDMCPNESRYMCPAKLRSKQHKITKKMYSY